MIASKVKDWVDTYWRYIVAGENEVTALAKTCFRFQLSSWEEDLLRKEIRA